MESSNGMDGTLTASQSMDSVHTASDDEVRTLFISGLPLDTKPRELYLLFRNYKPVGFVTFISRSLAEQAKQDLQGVKFDPDLPQSIRLEFAKSNTKVSKPKQQSPPAAALPTFLQPFSGPEIVAPLLHNGPELWNPFAAYAAELASPASAMPSHHQLLQNLQAASMPHFFQAGQLQLAQLAAAGQYPTALLTAAGLPAFLAAQQASQQPTFIPATSMAAAQFQQQQQQHLGISPSSTPCTTLFVANLGSTVNEHELKDTFASFPGFCRLRMHNKNGSPIAFVEYLDVRQALVAKSTLQGHCLLSSDRGGIRIEFARHKMGDSKKDENFNNQPSPISVQSC